MSGTATTISFLGPTSSSSNSVTTGGERGDSLTLSSFGRNAVIGVACGAAVLLLAIAFLIGWIMHMRIKGRRSSGRLTEIDREPANGTNEAHPDMIHSFTIVPFTSTPSLPIAQGHLYTQSIRSISRPPSSYIPPTSSTRSSPQMVSHPLPRSSPRPTPPSLPTLNTTSTSTRSRPPSPPRSQSMSFLDLDPEFGGRPVSRSPSVWTTAPPRYTMSPYVPPTFIGTAHTS